MPEYRRSLVPGGTFFFTVVTYRRRPILVSEESRAILHAAWNNVCERYPFQTDAICLLPDHIHCIWTLPERDNQYSLRWGEIKRIFSEAYNRPIGAKAKVNESRQKRGETAIWQRRFWEHTIRDLDDYQHHLDYIHYNPVKHGLVNNVIDWEWSSFHRYVRLGQCEKEWGSNMGEKTWDIKFGE